MTKTETVKAIAASLGAAFKDYLPNKWTPKVAQQLSCKDGGAWDYKNYGGERSTATGWAKVSKARSKAKGS